MKVGFLGFNATPWLRVRCLFATTKLYDIEFFYFTPERVNVQEKTIKGIFFENGKYIVSNLGQITPPDREKETAIPF